MILAKESGGVPPAARVELERYLRTSGSTLSVSEALGRAVKDWIAAQHAAAEPVSGYQWKGLFLPSGSRLRMQYDGEPHFAHVLGSELLYKGLSVSPRQFTIVVAGEGRNAWRDLWVRLHGEKNWVAAAELRRELEGRPAPLTPIDAMAAAARTMSAAMQSTLSLVEHIHYKATRQLERRLPKSRRMEDLLDD